MCVTRNFTWSRKKNARDDENGITTQVVDICVDDGVVIEHGHERSAHDVVVFVVWCDDLHLFGPSAVDHAALVSMITDDYHCPTLLPEVRTSSM